MGSGSSGAPLHARPRATGGRAAPALALLALVLVVWILVLTAGNGLQHFFSRAVQPPSAGAAELRQLACIQGVIDRHSVPGERVQIRSADPYFEQRVFDMEVPRLVPVPSGGDAVIDVGAGSGGTCPGVTVSVRAP